MAVVQGNGTIVKRERTKGRPSWQLRISLGTDPITGKRRRLSKVVHGTKKQATKELQNWIQELDNGIRLDADSITFQQYATNWQIYREQTAAVRRSTLEKDADTIRKLCKHIGNTRLVDLNAPTIKELYKEISASGLGPNSMHNVHVKLKQILQAAVNDDILLRNPCDKVEAPRMEKNNDRRSLTDEEVSRLAAILDDAGDDDARVIGVRLGLATGMRIGEVMGLTWEHVDLDAGMLEVVQQYGEHGDIVPPKSEAGLRRISLDTGTVEHLRTWKEQQALYLAALFVRQKDITPVITNERGGFLGTGNYRRWFQNFCVANGFGTWTTETGDDVKPTEYIKKGDRAHGGKGARRAQGNGRDANGKPYSRTNKKQKTVKHYRGLRFHELRHTQATQLIAAGEDIKTVQSRLGHSNVSLTLDMYAHALPEKDREAANIIGALMDKRPPKNKVVNL